MAATWAPSPIVAKLIRAGADVNLVVNARGETALRRASAPPVYAIGTNKPRLYRRQTETISLLLKAGANVKVVTHDGYTALLQAVLKSGEDQIRVLISNGAYVNQRTALGTPIEIRDSNKVRMLLNAWAKTTDVPENLLEEFIRPIKGAGDI